MKTKAAQVSYLLLAAVFVAAIDWFVCDPAVAASISAAFVAVVGMFLGLDIATMIGKTGRLPPGSYKEINKHRYVVALWIFAALLGEAVWLSAAQGRQVDSLYLCYGVGFLVVVGGLVGGIEANKMATATGPALLAEPPLCPPQHNCK